ncbi:nucleoside recognition domain-containing protein [Rivularia sp. UHCC 0363]|uniref:nucleoside recognition domain-containing protein n=1 Tax=Rivularia sp. UHCC 0363 TaxID=3110244 RepID=UPI002B1E925A|nr:nucleoside recognition domain-containing protein [Rivularia sp. UHCC 0363]MEA5593334.1 nucleoside recognition domain-containing protein [Rivularia sp. UHCC 0363]
MARAAFVMDRLMRLIGLPGKSFVPMIVGFGCNIPGIMATRTLENKRDRLMTVMMNPFMSCSARLAVYALFCGAFFTVGSQNIVLSLYLLGIIAAIFTGLILKYYQVATIAEHPSSSIAWVVGLSLAMAVTIFGLKMAGTARRKEVISH